MRVKRIWTKLALIVGVGLLFFSGGSPAVAAVSAASTNSAATKTVTTGDYQTAIANGLQYINSEVAAGLDAWDALALVRGDQPMTASQNQKLGAAIKSAFAQLDGHYAATDLEKTLIGVVAVGGDPTNYEGHNLVTDVEKAAVTKDAGLNGQIYGIIALSTNDYGSASKAVIKQLAADILGEQKNGGYVTANKRFLISR